ncbi:MAG: DMT family transporter [Lachnospiraceae bacterium]|nr:DMT family transporter [Lachnospiraceae bacterium]
MNKKRRNSLLLILTAFIWGTAFVAQSTGGDALGPYTFNCIRSILAGIVLIPVIRFLDGIGLTKQKMKHEKEKRELLIGGICCGVVLAAASSFQQMGLYFGTSAGKAGFLTSCYILLVPIFGLFLRKRCGINVWIGIGIAMIGLYLLCMNGTLSIQFSDGLLMLCACFFAIHILVIDHFAARTDGVRMACIQFLVCGAVSAVLMFLIDMHASIGGFLALKSLLRSPDAWISVLYAGILSSGAGYTLQIIGQQEVEPAIASLLMSLESVFSVLAGWALLGEILSAKEVFGCMLIFGSVILAQLPVKRAEF